MKALFSLSLILFLGQFAMGQNQTASTSSNSRNISQETSSEIDWANFENEMTDENWSFHTNQKSKLLYIDFEALGGKMNRLVLKSAEKTVVMEDNHLFDLPVNTIYEVNLENLKRGSYFVELYTYDEKLIHKEIVVE